MVFLLCILLCVEMASRLLILTAFFAEKARLHAEAKAAEIMKRKAEEQAAVLERQKREVEREEARRALQQVNTFTMQLRSLVN